MLIGKNTMDQFATGLNGTRSPEPLCRNAIDPAYIPGGSSSGSAVAVARDIVSFALGSDTGGSGRVPAACNGIVGLKPTIGLVSGRGTVYNSRFLDCVPVFTRRCAERTRFCASSRAMIHAIPAAGVTRMISRSRPRRRRRAGSPCRARGR